MNTVTIRRDYKTSPSMRARAKEHHYQNAEKLKQKMRDRYAQNREQKKRRVRLDRSIERSRVLVFLGGRCEWCGVNDSRLLQVDHINGGGQKERRNLGWAGIEKRVFKCPPDYQLLCANCNLIKKWFELGSYAI